MHQIAPLKKISEGMPPNLPSKAAQYIPQVGCIFHLNIIPLMFVHGFTPLIAIAMRIARGVRGHAPPRIFLKRCNLVRVRVYFDQSLSLFFFSKITIFYIKNKYFRYTFAMGYFSQSNF